jgi:hypothetical protein
MNLFKTLSVSFLTAAASLALLLAPDSKAAGPMPFTANQFPVWYATATTPVSVTGTTEGLLYQVALPPNVMGTGGFMRLTLFLTGDGVDVSHAVRGYIGGSIITNFPPTGGTAIFTNTFHTTVSTPVVTYVLPAGIAGTNRVYSSTTTNSYNVPLLSKGFAVGTDTNATYLTITGTGGGGGNVVTLDGIIVEALQAP